MANVYCEYCGERDSSIRTLVVKPCPKHPLGFLKGKHKLYEGGEKAMYTCKYCGATEKILKTLVVKPCPKHPNGFCKGNHAPAL